MLKKALQFLITLFEFSSAFEILNRAEDINCEGRTQGKIILKSYRNLCYDFNLGGGGGGERHRLMMGTQILHL